MTVPLVVLARRRPVGGLLNLPFSDGSKFLEQWLEPVFGEAEHQLHAVRAAAAVDLRRHRRRRRHRRHLARLPGLRAPARSRPSSPTVLAHGWYYDDAIAAVRGRPRRRRLRGRRLVRPHVDRRRRQRRRQGSRGCSGRRLRALQTGYVRNYALGIAIGAVLLLGWFVSRGVRLMARPSASRSSPSLVLAARRRGARRGAPAEAPPRAGPARRHPVRRWPRPRSRVCLLDRRSRPVRRRRSSSSTQHLWIKRVGHLLAPRRRRHLAVPRRAHRRAVPARHPRAADRATTTTSPTRRGCCCSRPAARRVPGPRPVPVLRVLRDRARADVLPHRRLGLRRARLRRRSSSSSTRWLGSAFMLVGHRWPRCSCTSNATGVLTFDLVADRQRPGDRGHAPARWLFLAFAIAFAVKVPLFPLHTWLPDAHTQAPDGRVGDPGRRHAEARHLRVPALRPVPVPRGRRLVRARVLVTLGVIGIIYGAICATMQKDLKRLVAYSSVAHLGFIVLGTFALTTAEHQGRRAADGEPRRLHRRPVPPRRHDLRAPPHPRDLRAQGPAEGRRRSSPPSSRW